MSVCRTRVKIIQSSVAPLFFQFNVNVFDQEEQKRAVRVRVRVRAYNIKVALIVTTGMCMFLALGSLGDASHGRILGGCNVSLCLIKDHHRRRMRRSVLTTPKQMFLQYIQPTSSGYQTQKGWRRVKRTRGKLRMSLHTNKVRMILHLQDLHTLTRS